MTATDPRSWLDKLVGAAVAVLVAALALYIAARLVAAVWMILLACLVVGVIVGLAVVVVRGRSSGW